MPLQQENAVFGPAAYTCITDHFTGYHGAAPLSMPGGRFFHTGRGGAA